MSESSFWTRTRASSILAISEALFPENDLGAPDWRQTELPKRTLEYLQELPPPQGRLVSFMFVFVELATILLSLRLKRFSALDIEHRTRLVQGWRKHWFQPLRWLGDGVKATMTMMYMSHESVMSHIGAFKVCARPDDTLQLRTDPDALKRINLSKYGA